MNQMFAEYRTTGAKEFDRAVRDYRATPKKKKGVGKGEK